MIRRVADVVRFFLRGAESMPLPWMVVRLIVRVNRMRGGPHVIENIKRKMLLLLLLVLLFLGRPPRTKMRSLKHSSYARLIKPRASNAPQTRIKCNFHHHASMNSQAAAREYNVSPYATSDVCFSRGDIF